MISDTWLFHQKKAPQQSTVLLPSLQWGMMGSNNHIITNSASALSDVREIKRAHRVHAWASSPTSHRNLSHMNKLAQTFIRLMKHNHTFQNGEPPHTHNCLFGCQHKRLRFRSTSAKSGQRWHDWVREALRALQQITHWQTSICFQGHKTLHWVASQPEEKRLTVRQMAHLASAGTLGEINKNEPRKDMLKEIRNRVWRETASHS